MFFSVTLKMAVHRGEENIKRQPDYLAFSHSALIQREVTYSDYRSRSLRNRGEPS